MEIKTKFNIGDVVYFFEEEKVIKEKITDIEIEVCTTKAVTTTSFEKCCINKNEKPHIFIRYTLENSFKGENELLLKEEAQRKLNEIYINKIKELD